MDLQFLCFAFSGLVIVAFWLGIRIGFGIMQKRDIQAMRVGLGMIQKRNGDRLRNLISALDEICYPGNFTDDLTPPFRCRPMTVEDAAKIAKEALLKDLEFEPEERKRGGDERNHEKESDGHGF